MGFGTPPAAAATPPVYNAPNLGPLIDFQLANIPSDSFGKLPVVALASQCHYQPLLGDKALFSPINNITTTVRLLQLLDYSQYALAAEAANCGGSMATVPVAGRYIYMPQGFSASGVRGANLYRYDPWLDAWATMTAITALGAAYRFDYFNGVLSDGGDFVYIFGIWDGTDNLGTARYSISGNSYTLMADAPGGVVPGGGCEGPIGDFIYVENGAAVQQLYRYSISGNSWTTLTAPPGDHVRGGLVQDPATPDNLYAVGGIAGGGRVERYSIAGNSWTTLTGTGIPGDVWAKGIFFTAPVPCILLPRVSTTALWVYKV